MPIAHSVFKQTVLNVSAHQLQQHTTEICCKMIKLLYQRTREETILCRQQNGLFISALRWPAMVCVFDSVLA